MSLLKFIAFKLRAIFALICKFFLQKRKGAKMKYKDFDFRIWHPNRGYLDSAVYYFYKSEADRDDICELEIWTGLKDLKGQKLYENDIVRCGEIGHLSNEFGIIHCHLDDYIGLQFFVYYFDDKENFKEKFELSKINNHFVIVSNARENKKLILLEKEQTEEVNDDFCKS